MPNMDTLSLGSMQPEIPRLLLNRAQAAAALCVSLRTLDRLVATGELTPRIIRGAVRFTPASLAAFAAGEAVVAIPGRVQSRYARSVTRRRQQP